MLNKWLKKARVWAEENFGNRVWLFDIMLVMLIGCFIYVSVK